MRFLPEGIFERPEQMEEIESLFSRAAARESQTLHEHEVYELLALSGIGVPRWHFHSVALADEELPGRLPHAGPLVAKVVIEGMVHKSDLGGVTFNVMADKTAGVAADLRRRFSAQRLEGILFAEEIEHGAELGGELMLGLYQDPFFGPCLSIGLGGAGVEYLKGIMRPQATGLFLPAEVELASVEELLRELPAVALAEGRVRGSRRRLSFEEILEALRVFQRLGRFFSAANPEAPFVLEELEVNPAVARAGKLVALDGVGVVRRNDRPRPLPKPLARIGKLLEPETVAIAGASGKNPANPANLILRKFLDRNFPRERIFLIHPKEEAIEGIPCVRDVKGLLDARRGEPVDCLVVGVPAKIAGKMAAEALEVFAAHAVQIIAAGFGETEGGRAMQAELEERLVALDASPERRAVINGPNTLGNLSGSTSTLFTVPHKSSGTGRGAREVALICQSGAFMITRFSDLADAVAPRVAISVGNQMDLSVADFFEFLLRDSALRSFGLYIEGLKPGDGLRLMKLIRRAVLEGRYVVLSKAGRTEEGMTAARGHTAAMGGDYGMFAHLVSLAGGMVAESSAEFDDLLMLASHGEAFAALRDLPCGRKVRVAMFSNAGFERCSLADHLLAGRTEELELAKYGDAAHQKIAEVYRARGITGIVDLHEVLDLSPMMDDEGYERIARVALEDEGVDAAIFALVPETVWLSTCEPSPKREEDVRREGSVMNRLIRLRRETAKPFAVSWESGPRYDNVRATLLEAGIPCFGSADAAARAIAKLIGAVRGR